MALELADLQGTVRTGDWLSGFPAPHRHRRRQVVAVEWVDRNLSSGRPQAAVTVVVAHLKADLLDRLCGVEVFFSADPGAEPGL
ncbi:hypothetical protein [Deinococcus aquaedulcis]|uniref:hypothetical protein n=1 Tax=Deinococcus aquaedulcis TaxID=2840455 RepID=UPI001C8297EB|nr:hypothetical protein [Deinococcus aquaedulcis]